MESEKTPTVAELRQQNYKVRILQFRRNRTAGNKPGKLFSVIDLPGTERHHLGGKTRIEITSPQGKELIGEAICIKEDPFNRKVGIKIALEKALKEA
jgi:hypothetical protein